MTPIGHTLTGLAIGYAAIPRDTTRNLKAWLLAAFAVLASAPDLPFPYWGHGRYFFSHSLFATAVGVIVLEVILAQRFRCRPPVGVSVMIGMAIAWFSHLLLDSLYNHAIGMHIYWPFSDAKFALPVPWLSIGDKNHILSLHNVKVALLEILTFGPLLLLAVLMKRLTPLRNAQKSSPAD